MKKSFNIIIPALNEENNIKLLLESLLQQNFGKNILKKILVISDGSTDNTVDISNHISKHITVKSYSIRLGKSKRLNNEFYKNSADVIIVIDADQTIKDRYTINNMLNKFKNNKVGLVCGNVISMKPDNFFRNIAYFGYSVWNEARESLRSSGIRYHVDGGLLAYSRDFAKTLRFPIRKSYIDDDTYSFYAAIRNNFKVIYSHNSTSYNKLPANLVDYVSQMIRYLNAIHFNDKEFDKSLLDKYEILTNSVKFKAYVHNFYKKPIFGILYILLQISTKIISLLVKPTNLWREVQSTK